MRVVDPLRKPDVSATSRASLPPFLPTLGLALVAALMSFACREPAKQGPEVTGSLGISAPSQALPAMTVAPSLSPFNPGNALVADLQPVPASEAFARLAPLVAMGESEAASRPARPPAMARAERRRSSPGRLATTQPTPPPKSMSAPATAAETEGSRFLPAGALPFAAIDAAWDAARSAGTGAAHLGSSVVSLVSELR